ncbi:MAG: IclR family transcriptional regulator, partial [Deinococcales bacterium]
AYRYVAALRDAGMIWDLPAGRVGLGPRSVQLELGFRKALDEWSPCQGVMRELAEVTGETVALLVPLGHEAVCVDTVESAQPLRYSLAKGMTKPMLRGAPAKAMLPFLTPEFLNELLRAEEGPAAVDRDTILAELPGIRAQGYAVSREEVDRGVWAVGVPVLNDAGGLEGALSLLAPLVRVEGREAFLVNATVEAAAQIPTIPGRGAGGVL